MSGILTWTRPAGHPGREGALGPAAVNLDAGQPRRDGEPVPAHGTVRVTVRNPAQVQIRAAHHPDIPTDNTAYHAEPDVGQPYRSGMSGWR